MVAVHSREALIIFVIILLAVAGSQLPVLVRTIMMARSQRTDADEAGQSLTEADRDREAR